MENFVRLIVEIDDEAMFHDNDESNTDDEQE